MEYEKPFSKIVIEHSYSEETDVLGWKSICQDLIDIILWPWEKSSH
jgi:hypothetical protein